MGHGKLWIYCLIYVREGVALVGAGRGREHYYLFRPFNYKRKHYVQRIRCVCATLNAVIAETLK